MDNIIQMPDASHPDKKPAYADVYIHPSADKLYCTDASCLNEGQGGKKSLVESNKTDASRLTEGTCKSMKQHMSVI